MLHSEVRTISCPDGQMQRIQLVRWEDWDRLHFLAPRPDDGAMDCFVRIYRQFLVPACPWLFGNLVIFRLPEDMELPCSQDGGAYGRVAERLTAAAIFLKSNVRLHGGKSSFRSTAAEKFYRELERRGCLEVVRGKLPVTTIIPVGNLSGFLSRAEQEAAMKVNASFFIMDRFDCATVYDHIGISLGLRVKDGVVENPPLYRREALLVKKDGSVAVTMPDIREMELQINGITFQHGRNAVLYTRPQRSRTPYDRKKKLVIIGCRVAAVAEGGSVPVPASGFVLSTEEAVNVQPGDAVCCRGMEDVRFGIQVGNSIVRDGVKTEAFRSRFYNIRRMEPVPYPPSLYPMDFHGGRAARIALGADREGRPMVLWAEGAAKVGHDPQKNSRGASLADMAQICSEAGMWNAVNLDGGGSAQILLNNRRELQISDRKEEDGTEVERPVPLALMIP